MQAKTFKQANFIRNFVRKRRWPKLICSKSSSFLLRQSRQLLNLLLKCASGVFGFSQVTIYTELRKSVTDINCKKGNWNLEAFHKLH